MKRMIVTAVCLLLTIAALTACGKNESKPSPTAYVQDDDAPVASEAAAHPWVRVRPTEGGEKIIEDLKDARTVADTLENAPFTNSVVSMSRQPDYAIDVGTKTGDNDYKIAGIYEVWISPQNDRLEIVKRSSGQYVQLTPEDSKPTLRILKSL